MKSITVPLTDEVERRIHERATGEGIPSEVLARTVLEREFAPSPQPTPVEIWLASWRDWVGSRTSESHTVDDSRESIYEGRGE